MLAPRHPADPTDPVRRDPRGWGGSGGVRPHHQLAADDPDRDPDHRARPRLLLVRAAARAAEPDPRRARPQSRPGQLRRRLLVGRVRLGRRRSGPAGDRRSGSTRPIVGGSSGASGRATRRIVGGSGGSSNLISSRSEKVKPPADRDSRADSRGRWGRISGALRGRACARARRAGRRSGCGAACADGVGPQLGRRRGARRIGLGAPRAAAALARGRAGFGSPRRRAAPRSRAPRRSPTRCPTW